jgi:hypothetical protein
MLVYLTVKHGITFQIALPELDQFTFDFRRVLTKTTVILFDAAGGSL